MEADRGICRAELRRSGDISRCCFGARARRAAFGCHQGCESCSTPGGSASCDASKATHFPKSARQIRRYAGQSGPVLGGVGRIASERPAGRNRGLRWIIHVANRTNKRIPRTRTAARLGIRHRGPCYVRVRAFSSRPVVDVGSTPTAPARAARSAVAGGRKTHVRGVVDWTSVGRPGCRRALVGVLDGPLAGTTQLTDDAGKF